MYCIRTLTLRKKASLSLTLKYVIQRQYIITNGIDFSIKPQLRHFCKNTSIKTLHNDSNKTIKNEDGLIRKLLKPFRYNREKYKLMSIGYLMYEDVVDRLNYPVFFKDFNMPDTFCSWFLITELHVWMLMVRFMAEGDAGKVVRNNLVEAMWEDIDERLNKLGPIRPSIKRKQLYMVSGQFNAALLSYDEGILSDDKVLASALWSRFFGLESNNPEHIEKLLIYVRQQMYLLHQIPSQVMMSSFHHEWIDLRSIR